MRARTAGFPGSGARAGGGIHLAGAAVRLGLGGEGHRYKIVLWNDDRGFGFITPLSKGPNVFVHISQFQHKNRRPCLNDRLTYVIGVDERGRARAMDVRVLNSTQLRAPRKKRFPLYHDAPSPRMRHGSTSRRTARACTLPDCKINAELIALVSRLRTVFAVLTGISGCI
jgi:cold shock CspA family protein